MEKIGAGISCVVGFFLSLFAFVHFIESGSVLGVILMALSMLGAIVGSYLIWGGYFDD